MNSSLNRKRGAMLSMANMIASLIIGLVYTPFLLRSFGQSEYGVYSLAKSIIGFLSIMDLGFGNALIRYSSRMRAQGKEDKNLNGMFLLFYSSISGIALIIGLFLMFNIKGFFGSSLTESEIHTLRVVFIILLINTVIAFPASVFSSIIRAYEGFTWINGITLLSNVLSHSVNLLFLLLGYKSITISLITLIFNSIVAILNVLYALKRLHIKIGFKRFEKSFYHEIFRYSFFILINMVVDQLYANTDNVILGKVCGSTAVAIYGVGVTFQAYFQQFSTSISGVFLPHISELSTKKNGIKQMSDCFLSVGHIQFIILSFIATGFTVFGKEFIALWAGNENSSAYYIALLIMIPSIIPLSQNIGISILQALNRHSIRSVMYFCIAIFNVAISIPLAMKYQGIGAAIGTACGNLLGQIVFMNWFYWKRIGIDIPAYWKQSIMIVIKTIPVTIAFGLSCLLINKSGWSGILIKIATGMLPVIPYYYYFMLNNSEKQLVKSIVVKISRKR